MDMNTLTPAYTVSGQIAPGDAAAIKSAGFTTVICNRPDAEVDPSEASDAVQAAVEAEGMTFVYNPVANGALNSENLRLQAEVLAQAPGPVFAYCRSGMRCSVVWALSQAGRSDADSLIAAAAQGGYDLEPLRPQIEAAARL
jgi:uncharacterized protein (TIGR01244 family)